MKSTIALIAIALIATVSGNVFAGDYCAKSKSYSKHSNYTSSSYRYETPRYEPTYCKPYKVSTCEVNRYKECRTAYDHCGKPYTYHVTIITYRDTYSDGSFKTYTAQS